MQTGLEKGETGAMMWVSFWVDKATLGLEMVVTQQYECTGHHRTIRL